MEKKIHKSFSVQPFAATTKDGEVVNVSEVLSHIKKDIILISDAVYLTMKSSIFDEYVDKLVCGSYQDINSGKVCKIPAQNNTAGRVLGSKIPDEVLSFLPGNISRYTEMYNDKLFREVRHVASRIESSRGSKYLSQGYKRTLDLSKSHDTFYKVSYSSVDKQLASIELNDGVTVWSVKTNGQWFKLYFDFNSNRFSDAEKITLPDVQIESDGNVSFKFSAQYPYIYGDISDRYIMGIDMGISKYVTYSIYDIKLDKTVETGILSRRFNQLYGKYRRQNRKFRNLAAKIKNSYSLMNQNSLKRAQRYTEYVYLREKISRTRKELSILAGQEVSDVSYQYDNCVIVMEDLSWIRNTMQNGRWNIGEMKKWINHYADLNGQRQINVNAAYTSRTCFKCETQDELRHHFSGRVFVCKKCGYQEDRDINASSNIARKGSKTAKKISSTRKKGKKYTPGKCKRTPKRRESLRYPGTSRKLLEVTTKNKRITQSNTDTVCVNGTDSNIGFHGVSTQNCGVANRDPEKASRKDKSYNHNKQCLL